MKVLFLGTPDFAVPSLNAICNSKNHRVVGVVCQPDRPGNRGKIVCCPVKEYAVKNEIKFFQYEKISRDGLADIKALAPDVLVTCAFGQILKENILNSAPYGVINVHGSLLPKYRGASPIQQAVLDGEEESGVTIMKTELSVDSGDIILVKKTPIYPEETAGELFDRLSYLGADAIVEALDLLQDGKAVFTKQDETKATYCKMIKKEDGKMDFFCDYKTLHNFVRGMSPWPSAFALLDNEPIKIKKISLRDIISSKERCGKIVFAGGKGLCVQIKDCVISLDVVQPAGKKEMSGADFCLGRKNLVGKVFNE